MSLGVLQRILSRLTSDCDSEPLGPCVQHLQGTWVGLLPTGHVRVVFPREFFWVKGLLNALRQASSVNNTVTSAVGTKRV